MLIPYYSPNFYFSDLLSSLFIRRADKKLEQYFRQYTGKEYILITASCRSALYLAYKSLAKQGTVITSPLTCKSAIDPVLWAGNNLLFADIDKNTLNHSESAILKLAKHKPVAIQLINHGGLAFDTKGFREKLLSNPLIVEDCAQAFGATKNGYPAGYFSDVACFSLIKNAYGIGGGIMATNDQMLFEKARNFQNEFSRFSTYIAIYRLIKNTLETYRHIGLFNAVYKKLLRSKSSGGFNLSVIKEKYLKKPHWLFSSVFIQQSKKIHNLHIQRKKTGLSIIQKLQEENLIGNYHDIDLSGSSFTKLFITHPSFKSKSLIDFFLKDNIEAKHLEQKANASIQPLLDEIYSTDKIEGLDDCVNYQKINDKIVSLPLHENMKPDQFDLLINKIKEFKSL